MDLKNLTMFNMLNHKMAYLGQRQSVLAQNVANADTPGYAAKDLKKLDFSEVMARQKQQQGLRLTHPNHLRMPGNGAGDYDVSLQGNTFEVIPVDNNVTLDEQMFEVNATAGDYHATANLYRKMNQMMRSSLGSSGGGN